MEKVANDKLNPLIINLRRKIADQRCQLRIESIRNQGDLFSWHEAWKFAVGMVGVCVRSGRSGSKFGVGEFRHLCFWFLGNSCLWL